MCNQKAYLEHALALIFAKGWSFVETAIWYHLTDCTDRPADQCTTDPDDYQAYYGLFDKNLNPKPVASSFFVPTDGNQPEPVTVPGSAENGVTIPIATTGTYNFTILGGVYSPWPEDNFPNDQWRSVLYFYRNRPVEWELQPWGFQPGNPDFSVGNWEITGETQEQAELRAMGETVSFSLQAGDQLVVAPVDVQGV